MKTPFIVGCIMFFLITGSGLFGAIEPIDWPLPFPMVSNTALKASTGAANFGFFQLPQLWVSGAQCVRDNGKGQKLSLGDCTDRFVFSGQQITSQKSGLCVDIAGGSTANGAPVILWDCHGNQNQKFALANGNLIGAQSGKCVGDGFVLGGNCLQFDFADQQPPTATETATETPNPPTATDTPIPTDTPTETPTAQPTATFMPPTPTATLQPYIQELINAAVAATVEAMNCQ